MNKEAVKILTSLNEEKFKSLTDKQMQFIEEHQKIVYEENIHRFNEKLHRVNKICLWASEEIFEEIKNRR